MRHDGFKNSPTPRACPGDGNRPDRRGPGPRRRGGAPTAQVKHFDPKGKPPSKFTIELRNGVKATLPFEDKRDFDEAKKGFIAEPPYKQIMADAGHVAWDMGSYQWLLQGKDFESIHPSLQRQAVLNMAYGLYEVVPGTIYQVRGFDLANISFIKGDTGWIVFDPLTAKETARAALEFINEKLGKRPVVGVVYSHSHVDHFGGVRGVVDEADVASGKVMVIAPEGFMEPRSPRTCSPATRCRGARSGSTRCCCRATRSATSTRRSARTWPTATSG